MLNDELHVSFYENIADFYHAIPVHLHNGVNNFAYQFKNWQDLLYQEFVLQRRPGHYEGAILYMGNAPLLGGHFVVKTTGRTRGLFLLGSGGETDYNDFIYFQEHVPNTYIEFFVHQVLQQTAQSVLRLSQIQQDSPLAMWAKEKAQYVKSNPCAQIALQDTFEQYWQTISKSVRKNIRTAQNRLRTDQKTWNITFLCGHPVPPPIVEKYQKIYQHRCDTKQQKHTLATWVWGCYQGWRKRKFNLMTKAMQTLENAYSAFITIDGEIAAYFYGILDAQARLCVMRVALNDRYSRYSPGMILLSKAIEKMHVQKNVRILDLTNGDEPYKFALGAVAHETQYYVFGIEK